MAATDTAYAAVVTATESPEAPCVVVDLSRVTFMDVSGVRMLLRAWAELTRDGRHLLLAEPVPRVARLLEMLDLERVFPIYPLLEVALADHAAAAARAHRGRHT